MSSRVLVTGGTGFIGAHLVKTLVDRGDDVHVLTRGSATPVRFSLLGIADRVTLRLGSIEEPQSVRSLVEELQPEMVYHLAAYGVRAMDSDINRATAVNITGPTHLLQALATSKVRRLVWVGTSFEYAAEVEGPICEEAPLLPPTLYGASKLAGWILARSLAHSLGLPLVTARCFAAYGPMEHLSKLVPYVVTTALEGRPIQLTSGEQGRDYLYVGDLVRGLITLGDAPNVMGEVFNLGSGQAVTVLDIVTVALRQLDRLNLLQVGARAHVRTESAVSVANIRKALRMLDWRPQTELEEGLHQTIEWYRRNKAKWRLLS